MSEHIALRITRASNALAEVTAPWVRLEQILPAKTARYASLADVYKAFVFAASGLSNRAVRPVDCPVEFDGQLVRFFLGFYAWMSAPELPYELSADIGEVGPQQLVRLPREFSVFANNTRTIDLEMYLEDVVVVWETPVWDRYGNRIARPIVSNHNTWLEFDRECFGALRVVGKAVGGYHVLTVEIDKGLWEEEDAPIPAQEQGDTTFVNQLYRTTTNSNKIGNIKPVITATWQAAPNIAASDQLTLEVPQCVLDVLAYCPGNPLFLLNWCETLSRTQVYYSTCEDDKVLKVCNGLDPHKYCSQIALQTDPGPWLKGLIS